MPTTLTRPHHSQRPLATRTPGLSGAAGSPWNQQLYGRLRRTLQGAVGRRSLILAVCDDLRERDRWVQQLGRDCGALGTALPDSLGESILGGARSRDSLGLATGLTTGLVTGLATGTAAGPTATSMVVQLDPHSPEPTPVTTAILAACDRAIDGLGLRGAPLQLCGIEQFTRLSARRQQALLRQLNDGAEQLEHTPVSWVIWLSRPWLDAIRQSAPRLWALQTAPIFEFEGDPTPTPPAPPAPWGNPAPPEVRRSPSPLALGVTEGALSPRLASGVAVHWRPGWRAWMRSLQGPPGAEAVDSQELERACELGCQLLERTDLTPGEQAELLADLSRCFTLQLTQGGSPAAAPSPEYQRWQRLCERALEATQRAIALLAALTPTGADGEIDPAAPLPWADPDGELPPAIAVAFELHCRLGHLLTERVRQGVQGAAGWQAVTEAYGRAIAIVTAPAAPPLDRDRLIATYNNLGTACWNLALHDPSPEPLQRAIAAYRAALHHYAPAASAPDDRYGLLQTNLGTAYLHLAHRSEEAPWLELAIDAFRAALPHRPAASHPVAYGATQLNLGTAHWRRYRQSAPTGAPQPPADLLHAIAAYEAALPIPTPTGQPSPHRREAARHLGLAYYHLATVFGSWLDDDRRRTAIARAFHAYCQGLDLPPQAHPHRDLLISALLRTLHAIARQDGPEAQRQALNQLPGPWIAPILEQLKPL